MAGRIVSFGNYTFPNEQHQFTTNFNNRVPITVRLPGVSGGFDEFGSSAAPTEVGRVTLDFTLVSTTPEGMTALRDAVNAIGNLGKNRLVMQPSDPGLTQRWCMARVHSISMPEQSNQLLSQKVNIVWQVSDPFWYKPGNTSTFIGSTFVFGTSLIGGGTPLSASGLLTATTFNNNGNVYTEAQIAIRPNTGQSCTDPIIRRLVNGQVADEVRWYGTLNAGDSLMIDPRTWSARLNGVEAYTSQFTAQTLEWMRLMPGTNNLEIRFAAPSDAAQVNIRYFERYT